MGPTEPNHPRKLGGVAAASLLIAALVMGGAVVWDRFLRAPVPTPGLPIPAGAGGDRAAPSDLPAPGRGTRAGEPEDDEAGFRDDRGGGAAPSGEDDERPARARPRRSAEEREWERGRPAESAPREAVIHEPRPAASSGYVPPSSSSSTSAARPARDTRTAPLDPPLMGGMAGRPVAEPAASTDEGDAEGPPSEDDPPDEDDNPDSDRSPPTIEGIRFDPPEVADGGATTIQLQVNDDLSGVKAVTGNLRSPSGAATLYFQAQGDPAGRVFSSRITIPAQAETGTWFVGYLHVLDKADNPLIATYTAATAFPGGTLQVVSKESDSAPPEVLRVQVEKGAVNGGEKNGVRVEATDDRSGISSVTGVFQSGTRAASVPFICRATADPQAWDGELQLPPAAECGEWTLHYVRVVDGAGNIALIRGDSSQFGRVGFQVSGEDCDSDAPVLESLQLSPTVVTNVSSSEIVVTAFVRDEGSGTASMLGWARGPISTNGTFPKIFFTCAHPPGAPEGLWTGKIAVPQHAAAGTWKLGLVRVQDAARNSRDYNENDPALVQGTFEVQ